jgi:hypothetical protein
VVSAFVAPRRIRDAEGHSTTIYSYTEIPGEPGREHALFSGIGPATLGLFTRDIEHDGHAIIENTSRDRKPWNHRIIGVGIGHDDAEFTECGRSMTAYDESGEAFDSPVVGSTRRRPEALRPQPRHDPQAGDPMTTAWGAANGELSTIS